MCMCKAADIFEGCGGSVRLGIGEGRGTFHVAPGKVSLQPTRDDGTSGKATEGGELEWD